MFWILGLTVCGAGLGVYISDCFRFWILGFMGLGPGFARRNVLELWVLRIMGSGSGFICQIVSKFWIECLWDGVRGSYYELCIKGSCVWVSGSSQTELRELIDCTMAFGN